ncbi:MULTISPECIES: glycoside hydrolase family protein [unclassified Nitrosovibrio]|uniref:glycoside hydrolase family protein n=1 Tax=unclassified Nitrosovibrio TaxID=2624428 RepID=UPI0008BA8936|nr:MULTISPECIES: glycoside hydrolase family protein [unclassified Nitrosovibrio]SEO52581.1 lysozyme [Nitrosovibrio sp. Nv6]SOD41718.1 lysozyme [Nitrosovibrio sp. Nv4]
MIKSSPTQVRSAVAVLVLAASTLVGLAVHEGYKDEAYIPVPGDVPTIGFGTTGGVRMGDKTTPERSLVRLLDEVEGIYAAGVKRCVTVPLYQHEYEAFVRLAYNVGVPTFCRKAQPGKPPNLIDLINSKKYAEACARIEAFKYGPGRKVLPGLVKRRAEERAICEGKKLGLSRTTQSQD